MRRLLHVAMTRARRRLVLAYPARHRARRGAAAVAVRRGGARGARRASGRSARRSCSARRRRCSRRSGCCATSCSTTVAQVGGRLGELRFDTDLDVSHAVVRYLEVLKLSRADGAPARRAVGRRGAAGGQRAAAAGGDRRAARDLRDVARSTSTCSTPSATRSCARGRVAQRTEPSLEQFLPRRGDGLVLSASDIETYRTCPLQVQVRARLPDPVGADAQPALRDPRPPGARALPRRRRGEPARCPSCSGCSTPAGAAAASATPRRSASCAPRRRRRCCATTSASRARTPSRSGSSARSRSRSARTCCAGASTASTSCPTAATS